MDPVIIAKREYDKSYRTSHLEQYSKYSLDWYYRNKTRMTCECGADIIALKKNVHYKSKKHMRHVASLTS